MSDLTAEELAARSGTMPEQITRLVDLGILRPNGEDKAFGAGDIQRVRLARALQESGLALGDVGRAKALLESDPRLANAVAEDGFGPLGLACFFDHEPVVRVLLDSGARVDQASSNGMRVMPLHSAAAARSVPIARLLLERGAPVNARQGPTESGFTPLIEAALNGQVEMVELLMRHGADASLKDGDGKTAADHARERGHAGLAGRLGSAPWS